MIVIWSSLVRCLRWCTTPSPAGCLTRDNGAKKSPLMVHVLNDLSGSGSSSHKSLENNNSIWGEICLKLQFVQQEKRQGLENAWRRRQYQGPWGYQESISDTPTHPLLCHLIQTLSVNVQLTLAPPVTLSPYKRPLSARCIATNRPHDHLTTDQSGKLTSLLRQPTFWFPSSSIQLTRVQPGAVIWPKLTKVNENLTWPSWRLDRSWVRLIPPPTHKWLH